MSIEAIMTRADFVAIERLASGEYLVTCERGFPFPMIDVIGTTIESALLMVKRRLLNECGAV